MNLSDRLAICSWSLQPQSPAELAQKLRAIGITRTQLALDPIRRGGEWADGIARLGDLGVTVPSGMFAAVGEDYSTPLHRRTGRIVPDSTWLRPSFHGWPMAQRGLTHVMFLRFRRAIK